MPKKFTEEPKMFHTATGNQYLVSKEQINPGDYIHTVNMPVEKVILIDLNRSTQPGYEHLYHVSGSGNQYKPCEIRGKIVATNNPELGLPTIKDYWLEQAHDRFEAANYHSEFDMVKNAIEYMTPEKAIEYLKQVDTP